MHPRRTRDLLHVRRAHWQAQGLRPPGSARCGPSAYSPKCPVRVLGARRAALRPGAAHRRRCRRRRSCAGAPWPSIPPLALLVPLQTLHALTYGARTSAPSCSSRAPSRTGAGNRTGFYSTIAAGTGPRHRRPDFRSTYSASAGAVFLVPGRRRGWASRQAHAVARTGDGQALWEKRRTGRSLAPQLRPAA